MITTTQAIEIAQRLLNDQLIPTDKSSDLRFIRDVAASIHPNPARRQSDRTEGLYIEQEVDDLALDWTSPYYEEERATA